MKKKYLREETIKLLKDLSAKKRQEIERKLEAILIRQSYWMEAKTIGITLSQSIEWDTRPIIKRAWDEGKQVAVPKCLPKTKEMEFYLIKSFDQLELAYFNIMEPLPDKTKKVQSNKIDLLVVPGLVFDQKGYRIGFGGGYYDRYLTRFKNNTVSLLSSYQLKDEIPRMEHDLPVQYLITEMGASKVFGGE